MVVQNASMWKLSLRSHAGGNHILNHLKTVVLNLSAQRWKETTKVFTIYVQEITIFAIIAD